MGFQPPEIHNSLTMPLKALSEKQMEILRKIGNEELISVAMNLNNGPQLLSQEQMSCILESGDQERIDLSNSSKEPFTEPRLCCGICKNPYFCSNVNGVEKPHKNPCGHEFGENCMDEWANSLQKNGAAVTCPACRYEIEPAIKIEWEDVDDMDEELDEVEFGWNQFVSLYDMDEELDQVDFGWNQFVSLYQRIVENRGEAELVASPGRLGDEIELLITPHLVVASVMQAHTLYNIERGQYGLFTHDFWAQNNYTEVERWQIWQLAEAASTVHSGNLSMMHASTSIIAAVYGAFRDFERESGNRWDPFYRRWVHTSTITEEWQHWVLGIQPPQQEGPFPWEVEVIAPPLPIPNNQSREISQEAISNQFLQTARGHDFYPWVNFVLNYGPHYLSQLYRDRFMDYRIDPARWM